MPPWVWVVAVAIAVASRPIEVRLWRAGRLSDRALAVLLLARLPLLTLFAIVAQRIFDPIGLLLLGISLLPGLLGYNWLLGIIREQRSNPS